MIKRILKILLRALIIIIVIGCLLVAVAAGYFYYTRWQKDNDEIITYSGDKVIIKSKKMELEPTVTCLFMGVNGALTDFIMLGKYDPNTREVNLMSIPRDTYVEDTVDHKINSAYGAGLRSEKYANRMNPEKAVAVVEELTGVEIDYYVLFKTKVLRELVDAVGGVTVTVPFNMNYEDPYQDLYIHLKKGTQLLNGNKAEQFVRYRSGYADGDVGRIKTQQEFIKAAIARCLEPQNLLKVGTLVDIVLSNTKTNITQDIATNYLDDVVAFKSDRVRIETLPGAGKYINSISYFVHDDVESKKLINEMFQTEHTVEEVMEILEQYGESGEESEKEVSASLREYNSGDKVRIEIINNGTSPKNYNAVIEKLNNAGYSVVRFGNSENPNDRLSSITSYVGGMDGLQLMDDISKLIGISKLKSSDRPNDELELTIVLGPGYEL